LRELRWGKADAIRFGKLDELSLMAIFGFLFILMRLVSFVEVETRAIETPKNL